MKVNIQKEERKKDTTTSNGTTDYSLKNEGNKYLKGKKRKDGMSGEHLYMLMQTPLKPIKECKIEKTKKKSEEMLHEIGCRMTRRGPPYSSLFLCFLLDEGRQPRCCWPLDLVWLISQPQETSAEVQNRRS